MVGPPATISAWPSMSAATEGYHRSPVMSGPRVQLNVSQSKMCVKRMPFRDWSLLPPATNTRPSESWTNPAQKMFAPATSIRVDTPVAGSQTAARVKLWSG